MSDEIDDRIRASFRRRADEVAAAAQAAPSTAGGVAASPGRRSGAARSRVLAVAAAVAVVVAGGVVWQSVADDRQDVRSTAGDDDGGPAVEQIGPAVEQIGPVANVDHWHAAFGINHCGQWLAPLTDVGEDRLGIHSHGDGLIHVHAFSPKVAGTNATLARFLDQVGVTVTEDAITLADGTVLRAADGCDGRPARVLIQSWSRAAVASGGEAHVRGSADAAVIAEDRMAFAVGIVVTEDGAMAAEQPPSVAFLDDVDEGLGGPTDGG